MTNRSTLAEAIAFRLRQGRLVGWRIGTRKQVEIGRDGARLILGWRDGRTGLAPADPYDPTINQGNLLGGIEVLEWTALPDTIDSITAPSEKDVMAAARTLGSTAVDRGKRADGVIIHYLR